MVHSKLTTSVNMRVNHCLCLLPFQNTLKRLKIYNCHFVCSAELFRFLVKDRFQVIL